jgi:hypothetical protein
MSGDLTYRRDIAFCQESQTRRLGCYPVLAREGKRAVGFAVPAEGELESSQKPGSGAFLQPTETQRVDEHGGAFCELQSTHENLRVGWRIRDTPSWPTVGGSIERKSLDCDRGFTLRRVPTLPGATFDLGGGISHTSVIGMAQPSPHDTIRFYSR